MTEHNNIPNPEHAPIEPTPIAIESKPPKRIKNRVAFGIPFLLLIVFSLATFGSTSLRVSLTIGQFMAVILPAILITRYYGLSAKDIIGDYKIKAMPLIGMIVFLAGLIICSDALFIKGLEVLPEFLAAEIEMQFEVQTQIINVPGLAGAVWFFLVVCLGAGIFEEVIFRGLILRASLNKSSVAWAIILNGILFAIMHGAIVASLYYCLLGAVLAYAAYRTGTLMYGIIIHVMLNFASFLLTKMYGTEMEIPLPFWIAVGGGVAGMIIGIAIFVHCTKGLTPKSDPVHEPDPENPQANAGV